MCHHDPSRGPVALDSYAAVRDILLVVQRGVAALDQWPGTGD